MRLDRRVRARLREERLLHLLDARGADGRLEPGLAWRRRLARLLLARLVRPDEIDVRFRHRRGLVRERALELLDRHPLRLGRLREQGLANQLVERLPLRGEDPFALLLDAVAEVRIEALVVGGENAVVDRVGRRMRFLRLALDRLASEVVADRGVLEIAEVVASAVPTRGAASTVASTSSDECGGVAAAALSRKMSQNKVTG